MIGDAAERFEEDPVRLLRALKLVGQYGFNFEDETGKVIYTSEMAHNYIPLVREGVKWNCRMDVVSAITETESYPYTIEIKGDTIINAVRYKKCYYIFEDESVATNDIPRAFLREDIGEKKVYALYYKQKKG